MHASSLGHNLDHVLANIFRYTPKHPVAECKICHDRVIQKGNYLHTRLPLSYQEPTPTTATTRYSMTVSQRDLPDEGHLDTLDTFWNSLGCTMNRSLFNHGTRLPPTRGMLREELGGMAKLVRPQSHFFLYLDSPNILEGDDLLDMLNQFTTNVYMWLVLDFVDSHEFLELHNVYRFDTTVNRLKISTHPVTPIRPNIVAITSRRQFLTPFLQVMGERSNRRTVVDILHQLQKTADNRTFFVSASQRTDLRKLFFGFG